MASMADISIVTSVETAESMPYADVEICSSASTITIDDENDDQDCNDSLVSLSDELYTHRFIPELPLPPSSSPPTAISVTDVHASDGTNGELAVSEIQDSTSSTHITESKGKERLKIVRPTSQAKDASFALAASGWFWMKRNLGFEEIEGLELKLEGICQSNRLLARLSSLRCSARKMKSKKRIMHLNVFPNEYTATSDRPLVFEDAADFSQEDRINHLETALAGANENVSQLKSTVRDLKWHLTAAEAETTETARSNKVLRSNNRMLLAENAEIARSNDILRARNQMLGDDHDKRDKPAALGKKRMSELGPTSVKETKRAYRQQFVPAINAFGKNRELEVEKLILRDREGERVVVNAAPSHAYDTLESAERQRVTREEYQSR